MKRKGFTLIELLAVVVVLGLVLALSAITITSVLTKSKRDSFEKVAESILRSVTAEKLKDPNLSLGFVNAEKLKELMTIDTNNFSTIKFMYQGDDIAIYLVGTNRYDGVTAFGTIDNMTVEETTVQSGLVLNLDAANPFSYPGSGAKWYDLSSGGYTGTLVNNPSYTTNNIGGIVFDGVDDYGTISNFNNDVMLSGKEAAAWTMEVWTSPNGNQSGSERMIVGRSGCYGGIYTGTTTLIYAIKTTACWTNAVSLTYTPPSMSGWYHLVATYNNRSMVYYVNGTSFATGTFTATMANYASTFYLGGIPSVYYYKGTIGNIRVYNKALSATEVKQNFDAQKTRYGL